MSCGIRTNHRTRGKMILNRDMFMNAIGNPAHVALIEAIRSETDEEKKKQMKKKKLDIFDFNIMYENGDKVKDCERVANTFLLDFDKSQLDAAGKTAKELVAYFTKSQEIIEDLAIVYGEYSVNGFVHVVCLRDPQLSHNQNIDRFLAKLPFVIDVDPKGRENWREGTFCTTPKDIWYIDDRLFEIKECPHIAEPEELKINVKGKKAKVEKAEKSEAVATAELPEITPDSHAAWHTALQRANLIDGKIDCDHLRYNNLMAIITKGGLPNLVEDESQALALVQHYMPVYWGKDEAKCRSLIKFGYHEWAGKADNDCETPPCLPVQLPETLNLLLKPFQPQFHEMLALAAMGYLPAIVSRARTYYYGKVIGGNQFVVIAMQSGRGKSQVQDLKKMIFSKTLQPLHDDECEKEYNNQIERDEKANHKDRPQKYFAKKRIFERVSLSSILQYQKNLGKNGMLALNFSEAKQLISMNRSEWSNLTSYLLKAWDIDHYDQDYLTSVNFNGQVNATMVVTGVLSDIVDGLNKRTDGGLTFRSILYAAQLPYSTLPPAITPLCEADQTRLDQLLGDAFDYDENRLNNDLYYIELPKTSQMVTAWYKEIEQKHQSGEYGEAELSPSTRIGQFMTRAALVLTATEGSETDEIVQFAEWLGRTAYYYVRKLFGQSLQRDQKKNEQYMLNVRRSSPVEDAFASMANIFSRQQFYAYRQKQNKCQTKEEEKKSNEASKKNIQALEKAGRIKVLSRNQFQKL